MFLDSSHLEKAMSLASWVKNSNLDVIQLTNPSQVQLPLIFMLQSIIKIPCWLNLMRIQLFTHKNTLPSKVNKTAHIEKKSSYFESQLSWSSDPESFSTMLVSFLWHSNSFSCPPLKLSYRFLLAYKEPSEHNWLYCIFFLPHCFPFSSFLFSD